MLKDINIYRIINKKAASLMDWLYIMLLKKRTYPDIFQKLFQFLIVNSRDKKNYLETDSKKSRRKDGIDIRTCKIEPILTLTTNMNYI